MQKKNLNCSLVVFPTSRAIRYSLNSFKNQNQLLDKTISVGDFFSRVIVPKDYKKQCDKNLKILFLKEAIQNTNISALGLSGDFSTFLKQSDYIFRFFNELSNEYVTFEQLLEVDTYALYSDHLEILKEIYKNYSAILEANGYTDSAMLPQSYTLNEDYLCQFDKVVFHLEGYLTAFEHKVIQEIAQKIETHIQLHLNQYNQKNKTLFSQPIQERLQLDCQYIINMSDEKIVEEKYEAIKNESIAIAPVDSPIEQIAFIKYHIASMVKSGIEPQNIAVIVPNEAVAFYLELFDDENYFNFAMGRAINHHKISQVVKLISKILGDKEPKDMEEFRFLGLKNEDFTNLFQLHWEKLIDKEIFHKVLEYLFGFEKDEELLEKLENLKISLEILLFTQVQNRPLKLKEFIKLFTNQLNTITLDDTHGGKITVLGILETRAVSFDGVIVIDFNDDKIPKRSIKDKFLSSALKQKAKLPTTNDRENLQRYYYKRVFDQARQIAICFVDDEQSVMSRFITQLFPQYKKHLQPALFKTILFQPNNLHHTQKEIVLDIDLSKQSWSATSLKSYLTCKRQYYFNTIQNIKQHTISLKPQNYEIGNIIHGCLENGVKEKQLNNQFIHNYLLPFQQTNPYLVLELELWKKKLEKFVEFEKVRASNGIKIESVEQPFNLSYNGIRIKGKIDRIDKYPDGTFEILDYKTSSNLKIDTQKTYEESTDFQLEFYYLSQREKMIKSVGYYDLNDSFIKSEVMLKEKLEYLDMHLSRLKTTTVNFELTDKVSDCQFCPYRTICQRD